MAASDHLNGGQWPLEQVGQLRSGNRPGMTVAQEYEAREVHGHHDAYDHQVARDYGYKDAGHYQASLTQHVAQNGMKKPGLWEPGDESLGEDPNDRVLANGYHRYAAARTLGHGAMPMQQWSLDVIRSAPVAGWEGSK